jgi:hypothetical protein
MEWVCEVGTGLIVYTADCMTMMMTVTATAAEVFILTYLCRGQLQSQHDQTDEE